MAKVLVVDDNRLDRRIAGGCVEQLGLEACFAENGREALMAIDRDHPDIILTDLRMPEIDGLELVKCVRNRYSSIPVVLMTAYGSEEIAIMALRAGAASYVPKHILAQELGGTFEIILSSLEATRNREKVREFLTHSEAQFQLGYERGASTALVSHLQDGLAQLNFCDDVGLFQVSTSLHEAIANAIDHGNLELDSKLREEHDGSYGKLREQREKERPYCDRRVSVTAEVTPNEARYAIKDEGKGFDVATLPNPKDPDNLMKPSGRGVILIRTFMDDVSFNSSGNEITMVKRRAD